MSLEHWETSSSTITERVRYLDDGWQANFYFMGRYHRLRRMGGRLMSCRYILESDSECRCEILAKSGLTESLVYDALITILINEIHAT